MALQMGDAGFVLQATTSFDWYQRQQDTGQSAAATKSTRDFRNLLQVQPVRGPDGKTLPGVLSWQITVHNLSGGLNRVWGVARQPSPYWPYSDLDRFTSSSLLTHDLGIVSLPTLSTLDSVGQSDRTAIASADVFGTHVVGTGKLASNCLFKETSRTNPALTALTYSPGANITYLAPTRLGSAVQSRRLAVCKGETASPIEILSDVAATPTSAGTMHVNTGACWGFLESPLNSASPGAPTMLIYSSGQFWTLDTTSAIGTAPTSATGGVATVPNGGYPVGIATLPGVPTRAYWYLPRSDQTQASIYDGTSGYTPFNAGYLVSTNLEGTDLQTIAIPIRPLWCAQIDDQTIWISDGLQVFEISDKVRNLHWATQRSQATATQKQCMGFLVQNGVGHVLSITDTTSASGTATIALERYQPSTNSWHQVSTDLANISSVAWPTNSDFPLRYQYTLGAPGSLPFSGITGNAHIGFTNTAGAGNGRFYRQFLPLDEYPPFYNSNDTTGAGTSNSQDFALTGSLTSVVYLLEGLEGFPSVIEEVRMMGDVAAGGSDASVTIDFADQLLGSFSFTGAMRATFGGGDRMDAMIYQVPNNRAWFTRLQYKLSINQGSGSTKRTSNALPFIIRGLCYTDGRIRSPAEARAGR